MWTTGAPTVEVVESFESFFRNEAEFWIHFGIGANRSNHGLYKTARLFCDRTVAGQRPDVVCWTFGAAQEFAAQIGKPVLLHVDVSMGADAVHMFSPGRNKYRVPMPLPEFQLGNAAKIVSGRFAPVNCAFCPTFVEARSYFMGRRNGTDMYVPFCDGHGDTAVKRYGG